MAGRPDYQVVFTAFWADTQEWSDDERHLGLYLLTCEHRASEGLYRLPQAYMAADMCWAPDRLQRALAGLQERDWLVYEHQWVFIRNALRWNQPRGPSQVTGAVRRLKDAPRPSFIWDSFMAASKHWTAELYRALVTYYGSPNGRT